MPGQNNGSLWTGNDTPPANDKHPVDETLSRDLAIYIVIIICNVLAIIINSFVIIITVSMATLRKCVSSYLVIKLCVFDILASCACLPKFIRLLSIGCDLAVEDNTYCVVYELLNGFFTYSICACILAINIDKYHSIKFPMHYSSHVTKTTVMITQGVILLSSIAFSTTPLYVTNGSHSRSCRFVYSHGLVSVPFAAVSTLIYFIIPAICMTCMNISVYRVAKRSLAQISAAPTITYDSFYNGNNCSLSKPKVCKASKEERPISVIAFADTSPAFCNSFGRKDSKNGTGVQNMFSNGGKSLLTGIEGVHCTDGLQCAKPSYNGWKTFPVVSTTPTPCDTPLREIPHVTIETSKLASGEIITHVPTTKKESGYKKNNFALKTNYKALRSLVLPFVYFIVIWGSYFAVYLNYVAGNYLENFSNYFTVVGIFVYISFALNPVIYVLMRKNFKEEAIEFFRLCRRKPSDLSVLELRMSQTFQQFLESSA